MSAAHPSSPTDAPTLVFAFDPLCGWCFGFQPVLHALRERYSRSIAIDIAMGGLVTGARERPVGMDADYLRRGLAMVEARTGMAAGEGYFRKILEPGDWISRSEPPCRAIMIARDMAGPTAALDLAEALTLALYRDGEAPDDEAVILARAQAVARRHPLDPADLLARWQGPQARADAQAMFARERARGVATYPSAFLVRQGLARQGLARQERLSPIFEGCLDENQATAAIDRALAATI